MRYLVGFLSFFLAASNGYSTNLPETMVYGSFGKIAIYKPVGIPTCVAIVVSGNHGWDSNSERLASYMIQQGAMVAGININHYLNVLKSLSVKCYYPSGDLEQLSMMLQKKYKLSQYYKPILVGYSSGAALVYGAIAQAPANTFKGAIVFRFNPGMEINKPLCGGAGLKVHAVKEGKSYSLEPASNLTAPLIVFHDLNDKAYPSASIIQFMKGISMGQLIEMKDIGQDFAASGKWLPQFSQALNMIVKMPSFAEQKNAQNLLIKSQHLVPLPGDMPLTIVPTAAKDTLPMVFFISGDGGWTSFDHSLGESLAAKGMPVVGLDAQKYFWNARTPESTTLETITAIQHYMQQWGKEKFILVGYSFGACVVPFIYNRLPVAMKHLYQGTYCLSPTETADFEIHISDMLDLGTDDDVYNVLDEIKKMGQHKPLCFFGEEEETETRTHFISTGSKVVVLPGSHHYNNNTAKITEEIIKNLNGSWKNK